MYNYKKNPTTLITWDESKRFLNKQKHGLDFEDACYVFGHQASCMTFKDTRRDYGEDRFITFGMLIGRLVVIVHTLRANSIRIISMRKANVREKESYKKRLEKARQDDGRRH